MTASLAASSPVLRRPLLSFAVRSDFLLKPRISARSSQWRAVSACRVIRFGGLNRSRVTHSWGGDRSVRHTAWPSPGLDAPRDGRSDGTIAARSGAGVEEQRLSRCAVSHEPLSVCAHPADPLPTCTPACRS